MMRGALIGRGLRIQRSRLRESMLRVDPVRTECRRRLRIKRRVYTVPGPNSLWYVYLLRKNTDLFCIFFAQYTKINNNYMKLIFSSRLVFSI